MKTTSMTKILFILLISFSGFILKAQQINFDSLNRIWLDEAQADTSRFEAMKTIAWDGYIFSKPDTAFKLAQQLIDLAQKKENSKWEITGIDIQASSFLLRGNYEEALKYYHRSLILKEEMGDRKGIASSLYNIGLIYSDQGKYKKALVYYQRSLAFNEENGDEKGIAISLNAIGIIYSDLGKYKEALEYYQRSLTINETIEDKRGIATSLSDIGTIYADQGKYKEALEHYQRSLAINEKMGHKRGITTNLNNIGTIYSDQGKYKEALEVHRRSLALKEEIGDKKGIASSLNNIAEIYNNQGKYKEALVVGKKSVAIAQEIGLPFLIQTTSTLLYEVYEKQGQGMKALEMYKLSRQMKDSLESKENIEKLQQMVFDKQLFQDSVANAEANRLVEEAHQEEVRQKNQTRNILFGIGGLLLLLAGGVYRRLRYVRKSKSILQIEKDRSENLLLNILPAEIAQELKDKGKADARDFNKVSILFTDFKGFTELSTILSAADLVKEINICFGAFDGIMEKFNIEKIKTIGDAYMAVGGLPMAMDSSVKNTVLAALEMQSFINKRKAKMDNEGKPSFEMRAGIHTGSVVAGIVGVKKFQYDIWGDAVNTASRMESSGKIGQVNISQTTYDLLKEDPDFSFESRGKIEAKGKGEIMMWFVSKN